MKFSIKNFCGKCDQMHSLVHFLYSDMLAKIEMNVKVNQNNNQ